MLASSGLDCIVCMAQFSELSTHGKTDIWLGLVKISMAKFNILYCIDTWYGMVGHGTVWSIQYGMVLYGMAL